MKGVHTAMKDLAHIQRQPTALPIPRLCEYAEAAVRVIRALQEAGAEPGQIIDFLKGASGPPPDAFAAEEAAFAQPPRVTYTATQIARKLGLYSAYDRPHAHAVSAILNHNLYIGEAHREDHILFETRDFTVYCARYDEYALGRVLEWVKNNGLPGFVDGLYYTYHVRYKNTAA